MQTRDFDGEKEITNDIKIEEGKNLNEIYIKNEFIYVAIVSDL